VTDGDQFRAAVAWAKSEIQDGRHVNGWDIATAGGWHSYLFEFAGKLVGYSTVWGYQGSPLSSDPGEFSAARAQAAWDERVAGLLSRAEIDPQSFETVVFGLASALERGEDIHPALRQFLAEVLRGRIKRPKPKAGRGEVGGLHGIITNLIADLVSAGWQPLRNDASAAFSACDVLARALSERSLTPLTYAGVKRIWTDRDKALVEVREAMREANRHQPNVAQ
jgi:hypothetical protein